MIEENVRAILQEIAAGNNLGEKITLVGASKTVSPENINLALSCGLKTVAENKVQEFTEKYPLVHCRDYQFIGHLQKNKVKYLIGKVSLIQSVDSIPLAEEIDRRAAQHGRTMDILVEVNAAGDEAKFGVGPDSAEALISDILKNCENIRVRGLMTVAPYAENPEDVRPHFHRMRLLYDKIASEIVHPRLDFQYLSMGMSNDRNIDVEEGSTAIRVGTAIFGARNYR